MKKQDKKKKTTWYSRNAEKVKARSSKRYYEKRDEISAKTKEDRKKNPGKYRLKRQKEKAKDPKGFKAKKMQIGQKTIQKTRQGYQRKG